MLIRSKTRGDEMKRRILLALLLGIVPAASLEAQSSEQRMALFD
jgi:hypothetical protein